MALYVKAALLYFNRFTIGSQLNSLNISTDGVLKSACYILNKKVKKMCLRGYSKIS